MLIKAIGDKMAKKKVLIILVVAFCVIVSGVLFSVAEINYAKKYSLDFCNLRLAGVVEINVISYNFFTRQSIIKVILYDGEYYEFSFTGRELTSIRVPESFGLS